MKNLLIMLVLFTLPFSFVYAGGPDKTKAGYVLQDKRDQRYWSLITGEGRSLKHGNKINTKVYQNKRDVNFLAFIENRQGYVFDQKLLTISASKLKTLPNKKRGYVIERFTLPAVSNLGEVKLKAVYGGFAHTTINHTHVHYIWIENE